MSDAPGKREAKPRPRRRRPGARLAGLGPALKLLRDERGWTQEEVGRRLKVDRSEVGAWERGRRVPSLARLGELAEQFQLDLGDLDEAIDLAAPTGRRRPPRKPASPVDQLAVILLPPGRRARPDELELISRLIDFVQDLFRRLPPSPRS